MFDCNYFKSLLKLDIAITVLEECDSTNNYIKLNQEKLADFSAVITLNQTSGRGRFDRRWICEPDKNLAMSLLLKNQNTVELSFYPILTSLAVSKSLKSLTGRDFQIKWPNDILYEGKKICGILCESRIKGNTSNIIIGIGINIGSDKTFYLNHKLDFAGSVFSETGIKLMPEEIAAAVIQSLNNICDRYKNGEKQNILREYCSHCVTLGRNIKYGENINGIAVDINLDGSLKVLLDNGKKENLTDASVIVQGLYSINQ